MYYLVENVGVGVHTCDARVAAINVGSLFTTALHFCFETVFFIEPKALLLR